MNLRELIEKKMREKSKEGFFQEAGQSNYNTGRFIKKSDAVEVTYKIMIEAGMPDDLDIEIEDENEGS